MLTKRIRTISRNHQGAGRSLSLRRAWFADGQNPGSGTPGQNPGTGSGTQGTGDENVDALPAWAQKLVKTLRDENADYRVGRNKAQEEAAAKAKELELAAQREQQRLVEEGKWKELADKYGADAARLKPYEERALALEAQIKAHNETRMARIPEDMRTVIPTDYLSPEQLSKWLDANEAKLTTPSAPNIDAGAGGSGGKPPVKLTDYEREVARMTGMSEAEYAKWKAAESGVPSGASDKLKDQIDNKGK